MASYKRLFNVLRRGRLASEIEREISFHLAERADALMGKGMSRRAARLDPMVALREE